MTNPTNANATLAGEANAESADMGGLHGERSTVERSMCEVAYSRGMGQHDNTPAQQSAPDFATFRESILADRATGKGRQWIAGAFAIAPDDATHQRAPERRQIIGKPHRCHACALPRRWVGLDVDGHGADFTAEAFAALVLHLQRYSGLVYTTASHTDAAPRCRVVLELDLAAPRAELIHAAQAIRARIAAAMTAEGHDVVPFDTACDRPEQPLFLPVTDSQIFRLDGVPLALGELLAEALPVAAQDAPQAPRVPEGGIVVDVGRHEDANALAGRLARSVVRGDMTEATAWAAVLAERDRGRWTRQIDDAELRRGFDGALAKLRSGEWKAPELPAVAANDAHMPAVRNATDLLAREFAPVQWGIRGILPEGISILSGDPKIGKSWLLYQACIAVATGKPLWHGREPEEQGDALYLALEDNDRRMQRRLKTLLPHFCSTSGKRFNYPTIARLHYATEWHRAEKGVEQLARWLRAHPQTRLVVIDTVSAFRDPEPGRKSAYATDYAVGAMLKPLTTEFSCAVVLVMHNRKQHSDDTLQMVSGTQGMTGGVDNVLVLRRVRGKLDAGLYVDGRDIEEPQEIAMHFSEGYWSSDGQSVDAARMSRERRDVLRVVAELGTDAKVRAIADALPAKKLASVKSLLSKMVRAGSLRLIDSVYVLAEWEPGTDPGTAEAA